MDTPRIVALIEERYGSRAQVSRTYGETTVDVAPGDWIGLLTSARDGGCVFLDWLTGVDEQSDGFSVVACVYDPDARVRLLLRTRVPREDPRLPSATGVFRGANWHERETFEMFGVVFDGHPNLVPLLLPEGFEGFPLRKEFVLASRVAKGWPGAKEPGESGHDAGSPSRRRTLPPGVPADWGAAVREGARDAGRPEGRDG
ncbi:NADH-quinone oxidoreductase subunit C [Planomonospora corallina]|uniref:NADH-quinone oxidoreductase subunit C n=1 Tax=Planomonospora corallina TaxID=1806052 RepID=A0ABV8I3X3_9ACTN